MDFFNEYMDNMPDIPNEFDRWVRDVCLKRSKYMFTFRSNGKKRMGFCTDCENIVSLDVNDYREYEESVMKNCSMKHNQVGQCPKCKAEVMYKDNGRCKGKIYDYSKAILLQKVDSNVSVLRFFDCLRNYSKCDKSSVSTQLTEEYRLFLDISKKQSVMFKRKVRYCSTFEYNAVGGIFSIGELIEKGDFEKMKKVNVNLQPYIDVPIYGLNNLNSMFPDNPFKWCPISMYHDEHKMSSFSFRRKNDVKFLNLYTKYPTQVEYLMKSGLAPLLVEYISYPTHHVLNFRAKNPQGLLKLSKSYISYFKKNSKEMSCRNIAYLQVLESCGLAQHELEYLYQNVDDYEFELVWRKIIQYTTLKKAINYIEKQKYITVMPIRYYRDYICDCEQLGYDLSTHSVLFPQNLYIAHVRTIEMRAAGENVGQHSENSSSYEELNKKYQQMYDTLCKKYEFHSDGLFIRPAKSVEELKHESKILNICVGYDNQSYIKNHAQKIAFILFIRLEEAPDVPFYTLEITNRDYIAQCRGLNNKGMDESVKCFVEKFKKYLGAKKH